MVPMDSQEAEGCYGPRTILTQMAYGGDGTSPNNTVSPTERGPRCSTQMAVRLCDYKSLNMTISAFIAW